MNIIEPKVEVVSRVDTADILKTIEDSYRICYKSESKGYPESFIRSKISIGHESPLEHAIITYDITCDRGVSHELVRHRIASPTQESTRYVNYMKKGLDFIRPIELPEGTVAYEIWEDACEKSEEAYMNMLSFGGATPQSARQVLNHSIRTKVRMTINMRSLRNFFRLRADSAAHPHMRQIAIPMLLWTREKIPALFDDIPYDESFVAEYGLENMAEVVYLKEE